MNWGHKITIVILTFIAAMLGMVYLAMRQTNEMMDENYYEQELNYQSLLNAAYNLNAISDHNLVVQNADGLVLHVPDQLITGFKTGKIELIRSEDKSKDLKFDFSPDSNGLFLIKNAALHPGSYKARIRWNSGGKEYYKEQELNIAG